MVKGCLFGLLMLFAFADVSVAAPPAAPAAAPPVAPAVAEAVTRPPANVLEQADDGSITLHGRHATVLGTTLRYEPEEKKQTLGFWTKAADAAEWTFTVRQAGEFDIEVLQGCGKGQGGSTMAITLDAGREGAAKPIEFIVEDTGHFQAFKPRVLGRVSLAAGSHTLHVQPRKIAKAAACDIRQVRLVPVNVPAK